MESRSKTTATLKWTFDAAPLEIGVDEAGRGPLFGRVYAAAVVIDPDSMTHEAAAAAGVEIKDSKKFHSKRKLGRAAEFIRSHAKYWAVAYEEASVVDEINIRRANFRAVHQCIADIIHQSNVVESKNIMVFMDGNDFLPMRFPRPKNDDDTNDEEDLVPAQTIVGGDRQFAPIACASILAKNARDTYIEELCTLEPYLDTYYGLMKNMGYGTKQHFEGLRTYGLSPYHRRSFVHL
jgi:ribonuclease HII